MDSNKKDAFDPDHYDIPMTIGLADGLYSIMLKLIEIKKSAQCRKTVLSLSARVVKSQSLERSLRKQRAERKLYKDYG